jgi:putative solute:sodium symporter small subunit
MCAGRDGDGFRHDSWRASLDCAEQARQCSLGRRIGKGEHVVDAQAKTSDDPEPRTRRRFPFFALLLWGAIVLGAARVVQTLNLVDVGAFPLGFFMAAQGCLIALLVVAIISGLRQDRVAPDGDQ